MGCTCRRVLIWVMYDSQHFIELNEDFFERKSDEKSRLFDELLRALAGGVGS